MIKIYKINNKTELEMFNKIHNCLLEPKSHYPYYCRVGAIYAGETASSTGWNRALESYTNNHKCEICSLFNFKDYLDELERHIGS